MNPKSQKSRLSLLTLLLAGVMTLAGVSAHAVPPPVTISGNICEGMQDPVTKTPVMNCTGINNAQVMVQDMEGSIVAYGTVSGSSWTADVPGPDTANGINVVRYVVMYSAPGHDATSREYRIDAAGNSSITMQNAYLPPLPLPKANLLVYAFRDRYLNSEDDAPDDPPFNGVTFIVRDENGNIAKMIDPATGTPVDAIGKSGSNRNIITTDGLVLAGAEADGYFYFTGLEPGEYTVEVEQATQASLPACEGPVATTTTTTDPTTGLPTTTTTLTPGTTFRQVCDGAGVCFDIASKCQNKGWYQNSTIEGGKGWEVTLFPGDPGTMAGGYMAWFSFVEKLGDTNTTSVGTGTGTITGVLRDSDGPFFAWIGEPWGPAPSTYVTPNYTVDRGLVVLWKDTVTDPDTGLTAPAAIATAVTGPDGLFTFTNVPPGNYRLFYEDLDLHYIWQEKRVTLAPGQTVSFLPDGNAGNGAADPAAAATAVGLADQSLYMPKWFGVIDGYVLDVTGVTGDYDTQFQCANAAPNQYNEIVQVCGYPKDANGNAVSPAGTPMAGAAVRMVLENGTVWKETTTDNNGYYKFVDLPEIEVMGHIEVVPPVAKDAQGNPLNYTLYHGKVVTGTFPTITYARDPGFIDTQFGTGMGRTIQNVDNTANNTYTFNLAGRSSVWYAANYRANLQLEQIPAGTGDVRGVVYYDSLAQGSWVANGTYEKDEKAFDGVTVELLYGDGTPVKCTETTVVQLPTVTTVLANGQPVYDANGNPVSQYTGQPIYQNNVEVALFDGNGQPLSALGAITVTVDVSGQILLSDSTGTAISLLDVNNAPVSLSVSTVTPTQTVTNNIIDPAYCANPTGNAMTTTASVDDVALTNQGYQPMGSVYPPDEFGGVFKNSGTPGRYEFRGLPAGKDYIVRVVPPALANGAPALLALSGNNALVTVNGGTSQEANVGLTTYTPGSVAANAPMGVPLAGEIEGGSFDDLNTQTNAESILWDEKKPLAYTAVGVYDHLGYFLGAVMMGNDLCHKFSSYLTDKKVCPNGEEGSELEYRVAPGPHIYVGNNDAAPWLTEYTCGKVERQARDANGALIQQIDPMGVPMVDPNTGNPVYAMAPADLQFPDQSPAAVLAGAVQSYTYCYKNANPNPWLPGSAFYPDYEPLPWTYSFGQGKNKFEADWSLLPLAIQEAPPFGGPLGTDLINPQSRPVINGVL